MDYFILLAIYLAYYSLSSKIKKISNKPYNNKMKSRQLKEFLDKNVSIVFDSEFAVNITGVLKSYDNTWIELEKIIEKKKKTIKENVFYKIDNIESITIDNKK